MVFCRQARLPALDGPWYGVQDLRGAGAGLCQHFLEQIDRRQLIARDGVLHRNLVGLLFRKPGALCR